MHVIVVGCGRVGSGLAMDLIDDGHTVAVVDRDESSFRRLGAGFGGHHLIGVGFDRDTLVAAGVERADALAAVTNGDNSNILIARVAKETFGVERVVARIYDPNRARIFQRLGIPTVATSRWTIEQVMRWITPNGWSIEWNDPTGSVAVVDVVVDSALAGRSLRELDLRDCARPLALTRLGVASLVEDDVVLQEDDLLHIAVAIDRMGDLEDRLAARRGGH